MSLNAIEIEQCRKTIAATAKAMLVGDCSYIEGSRLICGLFDGARIDQFTKPFVTFVAIDSQTAAVPFGWLRERWHPETRAKYEAEWDEAENYATTFGEAACREAIAWLSYTRRTAANHPRHSQITVAPAKAGADLTARHGTAIAIGQLAWVPAFAGTTGIRLRHCPANLSTTRAFRLCAAAAICAG